MENIATGPSFVCPVECRTGKLKDRKVNATVSAVTMCCNRLIRKPFSAQFVRLKSWWRFLPRLPKLKSFSRLWSGFKENNQNLKKVKVRPWVSVTPKVFYLLFLRIFTNDIYLSREGKLQNKFKELNREKNHE